MSLALEPGPLGAKINISTEKAGRLLGADVFINMPVFNPAQLIAEIQKLLPAVPLLEKSRQEEKQNKDN